MEGPFIEDPPGRVKEGGRTSQKLSVKFTPPYRKSDRSLKLVEVIRLSALFERAKE